MKDEDKQAILYFWNKIEVMLYGTPRFSVKPQETFEKIEESLTRDALSVILKDFKAEKRRETMPNPATSFPPGMPPLPGMPPAPGMPANFPGFPANFPCAPPVPGMPLNFNPMSMEPPGARMGPGLMGGPPSMEDEIDRLKNHEDIVQMLLVVMDRERPDCDETRLYRLFKLVLELGGQKVKW